MKVDIKKSVDEFTNYEIARWSALFDGVNLIAEVAEEKGIDFESIKIDQIALNKYVDEHADTVLEKMTF